MSERPVKVLIGTAIWNEGGKFRRLAERMDDFLRRHADDPEASYQFLVVDDGSTDGVFEAMQGRYPFLWHRHSKNSGAGASVRAIYRIARAEGAEIAVTIAGNNKDDPDQVPRLIRPIRREGFDLVQGSRYLPGGEHQGMPRYRVLATRYLHPWLLSRFAGQRISDSTNGFRALRLEFLDNSRLNLDQAWLDRYELEPYLLYQAIRLGGRVVEVPVTKIYPGPSDYTKMQPFSGWWSILRPLVLLKLGARK